MLPSFYFPLAEKATHSEVRSKRAGLISVRWDFSLQRCPGTRGCQGRGRESPPGKCASTFSFILLLSTALGTVDTLGHQTQFPP